MSWISKLFKREKEKKDTEDRGNPAPQKKPQSNWVVPSQISAEREEEMINTIVKLLRRSGMKDVAALYFDIFQPMSTIFSELALPYSPYVDSISGVQSGDYVQLFRNKDNVRKIKERLEED